MAKTVAKLNVIPFTDEQKIAFFDEFVKIKKELMYDTNITISMLDDEYIVEYDEDEIDRTTDLFGIMDIIENGVARNDFDNNNISNEETEYLAKQLAMYRKSKKK
jgi:hypothetical protein